MLEQIKKIAKIIDDKKGLDIEVYHVEEATTLTEYIVLATGTSSTHVKAVAGYVEEILKTEEGIAVHHSEGYNNSGWVLLDFGFALVNVMEQEMREHYNLEDLWKDTVKLDLGV